MQVKNQVGAWAQRAILAMTHSIADAVVVRDLEDFPSCTLPTPRGTHIEEASLADLLSCEGTSPHRNNLETRFQDSFLILARKGQQFMGYVWATNAERQDEGEGPFLYPVTPGASSIYLYDLFVDPAARNLGLGYLLLQKAAEVAKAKGFKRVFFTHDAENKVTTSLASKLGMTRVGVITFRKTMGFAKTNLDALQEVSR